ncbi:hypothetical protein COX25_05225 [bacterium (Candidatus Howlettbacteria) CG23_combo_of_CG06-09_8_20_14_all_37_9]|nr:MAG: hypothetical protein COX25_05225 [bacterium (Candidatus Howlettbacteria) CG23_combo_of_CG06-09_8_20_14_all_37_9]
MNEADKKVIEELLAKQTESFSRVLDVRFQEQEERLEKRMIHIFNEGFEQVVLPHITDIKEDISAMKEDIEDLRSTQARMDRKLDAVVERQDRQGEDIKGIKKFVQMPEGA